MSDKPFTFLSFLKNIGIMVGIGIVLILIFFYIYLPSSTNHKETITVPELVGMSFDDINEFVTQRNLRYEILSDSGYSESLDPLTILTQNPQPGSKVKENRKIYLSLNARVAPKIKMPNLLNTSKENAEDILVSNGLKPGSIEYTPSTAVNAVLAQKVDGEEVEAGTLVAKGSVVDLVIGDGVGNQSFPAPDFLGKSLDEVRFQIRGSGLVLDQINWRLNDTVPRNLIYKQLPPVGVRVRTGDIIEIWVNSEKPKETDETDDTAEMRD